MGIRRFLKPALLLRRKALRSGVFGGDRKWLGIYLVMFLWRRIKSLFGFGEPQPVMVEPVEPGQRFVVAHEDNSTSRRKRRKVDKKRSKKQAKQLARAEQKSARRAERLDKRAARKS